MTLSHSSTAKLSSVPNIKMLLLKAALKQSSYKRQKPSDISLPNKNFYFDGVELNDASCLLYHQVVDWELESDIIHPCYLHSLAFPLHIMLLLLPEFPFPLLGLIHVNNQIRQLRPINNGEKLCVSSCFEKLKLHPKGWLFSIKVEFFSGSEVVWQSISTNLFRTDHGKAVNQSNKYSIDTFTKPIVTTLKLNASLGRRYAKVSGDFNPIHLSKWSAKLFGFKQHIIHGMWTKSYCISMLQKMDPSIFLHAFEINTTFKQPLFLPNQVNLSVQSNESNSAHDKQHFKVVGLGEYNEQQPIHLVGNIRAI
jgi:hypothetical protein